MGWALDNLGSARCKEIAEGLFTVKKDYSGRSTLHGLCPLHDEKTPSFGYSYEKDAWTCKSDRGCGSGDLVDLWCRIEGGDLGDFRREFDPDYQSAPGAPRERKPRAKTPPSPPAPREAAPEAFVPESELEKLPPLLDLSGDDAAWAAELMRKRFWMPEAVRALDLRLFRDPAKNRRVAFPIRDDQDQLCNIRLYMPGASEYKLISWFDPACTKCGGKWKKVDKKKVCSSCGATPNDYGTARLYPPPSAWRPVGLLWLVEGEPDLVCAKSQGLNATTNTAGCGTWNHEWSKEMTGRDVVIAYDADEAGWKGAHKAAASIVEHARSVRALKWPEVMG